MTATRIESDYRVSGTLEASVNPLLEELAIRGTETGFWESPAAGTSRFIGERLNTDSFLDEVAARAGIADALDAGLVQPWEIRSAVSAQAIGQSFLRISSTWSDPQTAHALVEGTIAAYVEGLEVDAQADTREAVDFWAEAEREALAEFEAAEARLNDTIAGLPDDRSPNQELEVEQLTAEFERAEEVLLAARSSVAEAELDMRQAEGEVERQLRMVDEPEIPTSPQPVRREQIMSVMMYTLLGGVVASGALLLTTVLDRSVRSSAQLAFLTHTSAVVVDERGANRSRKKRAKRSRKK